MTFLLGIFTFFKTNIKWVAIILVTLSVFLVGWKFYSLTNEVASSKAEITRLNTEIKYKNLAIELYKSNVASVEEALKQKELEIRENLENFKDLQNGLSPDAADEAPPSTQEFIDRLRGKLN